MPFFRIIAFNHIIARDDYRWKAGYRVQVLIERSGPLSFDDGAVVIYFFCFVRLTLAQADLWPPPFSSMNSTPAPRMFPKTLPVEQPEERAEHDADDDAGDHGKIERGATALEYDIAGQPPEADPRQDRPQDPGDQDHQSEPDQKALHVHRLLHHRYSRAPSPLRLAVSERRFVLVDFTPYEP